MLEPKPSAFSPKRVAREVLDGGRMKGGIFKSRMSWVTQLRTAEERERLLAALLPETRTIVSGIVLAAHWYPFAALIDLDRNIMTLFGNGRPEFLQEVGRWSAKVNLSGTYKAFDRDTNHDFFRNSALLHSQYQDFGSATYEETGPSSGRMIHAGYPCFSRVYCESALGYYDGCITSHGATKAFVRETECQAFGDKSCIFDMRWM